MAMYEVINLLWSPSQGRYIGPGEEIELDDDAAQILLDGGNVKPAVATSTKEEKTSPRKARKEKGAAVEADNLMGADAPDRIGG